MWRGDARPELLDGALPGARPQTDLVQQLADDFGSAVRLGGLRELQLQVSRCPALAWVHTHVVLVQERDDLLVDDREAVSDSLCAGG